jgi:hypothetical protein
MRDLSLEQINSVVRNITAGVNIGVGEGKTDNAKDFVGCAGRNG